MLRKILVPALVAVTAAANAQSFFDDFNRPDAPNLGANWTPIGAASATRVISNQAGNVAGANNLSLVNAGNFSNSYANTTVSADIFHSGVAGTGFVALAFGHNGLAAAGNGLYIKLQTQGGSSLFTHVGFYTGIGNSSAAVWEAGPAVFFALGTGNEFASARMTVWASDADTINLGIDTNFDNTFEQTYSRNMLLGSMTFGNQVGLGVFGTNVTADNFRAVPEPATIAALGLGVAALIRRRRRLV